MEIKFIEAFDNQEPFLWLIEMGTKKLGVHRQKGWCMKFDDGRLVFFNSEDECMPLGPILEMEEQIFFEFLKEAAHANIDFAPVIAQFPKENLLKHIFHTSFSGYWPEKALKWLSADKDIQPLFGDELKKIISNKAIAQSARQQAKKLFSIAAKENFIDMEFVNK